MALARALRWTLASAADVGAGGQVFISYARRDIGYARRLDDFQRGQGLAVWVDWQVPNGGRWKDAVRERIDSCSAFVVVMTPAAEASAWVTRETSHAERQGRPICPLLLAGEAFFHLNDIQYDDVRDASMPTPGFVEQLRSHTLTWQSGSTSPPPDDGVPAAGPVVVGLPARNPALRRSG